MDQDQPIVRVRPVVASEWAELRAIRLHSLEDSPAAFGSAWATEIAYPDRVWRERAVPTPDRRMWSARREQEWLGLVGAVREADARIQLVSMWVDPAGRRQGVARTLIAAVIDWHRVTAGSGLYLWVNAENHAARRCYEREGFQLTGLRLPLPSNPARVRVEMRLATPAAAARNDPSRPRADRT